MATGAAAGSGREPRRRALRRVLQLHAEPGRRSEITRAKWLADLEATYRLAGYTLGVGAQNLFNVFPDRNTTVNSFNGIQTFPSHSPFGMNGRALVVRVGRIVLACQGSSLTAIVRQRQKPPGTQRFVVSLL